MAKVAKYIKANAVKQVHEISQLLKIFLDQTLPEITHLKMTDNIATLDAVNIKDIANQKNIEPPFNIGEIISNIVSEFSLHADVEIAWGLLKDLTDYSPILEKNTRPNGLKLFGNQTLLGQVLRCSALLGMSYVATQRDYNLRGPAIQARADIAELIDIELQELTNDEMKEMLIEFRDNSISYLSKEIKSLSTIVNVSNQQQKPSLVLAYEIYEDAKEANSLVKINDPQNSLFMPTNIEAAV